MRNGNTMTYKEIRANEEVNALLDKGNKNLGLLGFTDHSKAHCTHVAETTGHILKKFNYVVDKPLQVRQDYGSVYIVKAGGFKCLVDVAKDKMGTLIEI